jgi:mRNA interferase RelE/StbE
VYQVQDKVLVVTAVAVGRRERGLAYLAAKKRL